MLLGAVPSPLQSLRWLGFGRAHAVARTGRLDVKIRRGRGNLWTHCGTEVSHGDGGRAIPVLLERVLNTRQRGHSNTE